MPPIETILHPTDLSDASDEAFLPACAPPRGYAARLVVLHALLDRLPLAEAADPGEQLSMLIRGIYYAGSAPAGTPRGRTKEAFLAEVEAAFGERPHLNPEALTRAIFTALQRHVSAGEMGDVRGDLPEKLRSILR